ncbi:ABC transporter permease [Streptomyces sp. NPDC001508]|uniref:ABC transporter permease n=1 Tax=Streptomyces sp. NPDC001508 TaxID=3154656 RepID=UPI00332A76B2
MSALTAPAATSADPVHGGPRLTRWLLRLHRPALIVWTVLVLLGSALLLWLAGPLTDAAAEGWRQYNACGMTPRCTYDQDAILLHKSLYNYLTAAVVGLPFLVAAWAGAALTGRELESGTAQLAWTQGVTPTRWLALRLAVPAVAITVGTSLLVVLHRRAWSAAQGRIDTGKPWHDVWTFHANGPTTVALALAGLAAGVLAGLLRRRTLPALLLGLALAAGVWGAAQQLMPHLWPAVTEVTSLDKGYGHLYSGIQVDYGLVTAGGGHIPEPQCHTAVSGGCDKAFEKLGAVGYYSTYHPASHYWPLQLTTGALVLAVAGLCTAAAFWLLRRRTATPRTAQRATA